MPITDLRVHARAAKAASLVTTPNYPPQLLLGHFAIESKWGKSPIGKFNYVGMSHADRHELQVWRQTKEYFTNAQFNYWRQFPEKIRFISGKPLPSPGADGFTRFECVVEKPFADFQSLQDCYEDVVKLVGCVYAPRSSRYKEPWKRFKDGTTNWEQFAREYALIYATAVYGDTLVKIANQKNIMTALGAV